MRLVISNDRVATGNVVRIALLEQCRGRPAIIPPRPRAPQGHPHVQGIDHQLPLAPLHLLAALIAALGTAPLRRVDRRASEARGTGRGLPTRGPAGLFAPCRQQLDPRALGAPPRQVVVPRTLGQSIVWEHRPLTPASIQIQERLPHFAPVDCSWAAPTLGGAAGSNGARIVHWASVSAAGYGFRAGWSLNIVAPALTSMGSAPWLINHVSGQVAFPDSLSVRLAPLHNANSSCSGGQSITPPSPMPDNLGGGVKLGTAANDIHESCKINRAIRSVTALASAFKGVQSVRREACEKALTCRDSWLSWNYGNLIRHSVSLTPTRLYRRGGELWPGRSVLITCPSWIAR